MSRAAAFVLVVALTLAASVAGTPGTDWSQTPSLTAPVGLAGVQPLPLRPVMPSRSATDLIVAGEASSFVVAAPALRRGTLSYVGPKYGSRYLALPEPRGTVARICGPADCVTRRSTDYGPDQRVHPNRIADLSAADFVRVCGVPLSAGLCRGTVEIEPPVDPADDAARVEDGGPQVTVPPTDMEGVP